MQETAKRGNRLSGSRSANLFTEFLKEHHPFLNWTNIGIKVENDLPTGFAHYSYNVFGMNCSVQNYP